MYKHNFMAHTSRHTEYYDTQHNTSHSILQHTAVYDTQYITLHRYYNTQHILTLSSLYCTVVACI